MTLRFEVSAQQAPEALYNCAFQLHLLRELYCESRSVTLEEKALAGLSNMMQAISDTLEAVGDMLAEQQSSPDFRHQASQPVAPNLTTPRRASGQTGKAA